MPMHDANSGGGYGRTGKPTGASTTWQSGADFPYKSVDAITDEELDDIDDVWSDEDSASKFVNKVMSKYSTHDPYAFKHGRRDNSSLAHSSNRGLGETAMASGISPFPNMYKNRQTSSGGMSPTIYTTGPGLKGGKGSKRGWSTRPPARTNDNNEEARTWEDIPSDDERALLKVQNMHDELTNEFEQIFDDNGSNDEE